MKFTYRLQKEPSGWFAECVECDAMGEGQTRGDALRSLHASLEERMLRPDAVAPPAEETRAIIELELAVETPPHDALDRGVAGG